LQGAGEKVLFDPWYKPSFMGQSDTKEESKKPRLFGQPGKKCFPFGIDIFNIRSEL
jgi:hypothetical protein